MPLRLAAQAPPARPLVQGEVNPDQRVTLHGNVLPLVSAARGTAYDLGRIDDAQPIEGMYLALKRPPERETALRQFLADVQNPASADYREWLSPEAFGQRFGPADSDIAALKAWLESHGVTVKAASPGRIALPFSATAGAIRAAFGTEIHRYSIPAASPQTGQAAHSSATQSFLSNASDLQIPAAFAELVAGISPIGARPEAQLAVKGPTTYNLQTHQATPRFSVPSSSAIYELAPSDFAMQYGLTNVYSAGTTGAGQTIGIISDSNVDLSLITAYRSIFNLPASTPTVVVDGNDPGITSDATETYLDLEQAGAIAPGANLMLYTSSGAVLSDGLLTAAMRAVADNQATVLSVSYSACETALGVGGNAIWAALWQEAAAQGISVFVAAGDAGSAGCDTPGSATAALSGLAVNGLASTPYDTAVGGTDFYYSSYATGGSTLAAQIAAYWGTTAATTPMIGLLQPTPEQVWDDSFGFNTTDAGVYASANASLFAGGGGASSAAIQGATGALAGYPKPAWQSGAGVLPDGVRDLPDVALFAGDGANNVYLPACALPGDCVPSANAVTLTSVGGTSAAAPAMAAIQALVNAATNAPNGRSGLTAGLYYALATQYASAATKPLNDIITGTNQVPCYAGTLNCTLGSSGQTKGAYAEAGYPTTTGYDRASGLGSINVAALISDWSSLARKASATTLAVTPTTLAHGTAASARVSVAPASGTGTPTGSAAILSNSPQLFANGLGVTNLASASGTLTLSNLPGGTYQLTAEYGGDASYLPSLSTPVTVTVSQEQDTLATSGWIVNPLDGALYPLAAGMQIPYGAELYLDAQPLGVNEASSASAQNAPATGAISFTDKGSVATRTGSAILNSQGLAEWAPGVGTVGTHTISASYAGDLSYAASSASAVASYTVFKGTTTMYLSPMQTTAVAGGSVTVDVQLLSQYLPLIGSLPTGSVTVTLGGQSKTATWSSSGPSGSALEEAVVTFTAVPAGILPLSASYAGDANWNSSSLVWGSISSSGTKSVPTVTLTASSTSLTPAQSITLSGAVAGPSGSTTAPTGALAITWNGGASSYSGTLTASGSNSAAYSIAIPAYAFQNGTNLLVASYSGDGAYAASSSAPLSITLAAGDFSLTAATQQVAVTYGSTGAASVNLTPINGFSSPIVVTCTAPTGITCTVGTPSITIGSGATDAISLTLGAGLATGTWPVEVIASGGGHTHSTQILVTTTPQAPAPAFTPTAGTYTSAQLVTITDAAAGATIYYTTNGTTPTTASTRYTSAISVTTTETIQALATATGYVTSPVSSATYTITPLTAAPLISPAGGTYATAQSVTITDATPGAAIYYTTNGTTPTTSSTRYTGAISISSTQTINAVAIASGYALSTVTTAAFTIGSATATPVISPASGSYTTAQTVTITDATSGAVIYYTIDGSTPTTTSTPYAGPISVASSETINAVAIASGYALSPVASATYTIAGTTATPIISPPSGVYFNAQNVIMTDATPGAIIYYTTNGTTPTTASTKYSVAFHVYTAATIQAIAVAPGYANSAVATTALTFTAASPTFSPPPGTYDTPQTVTITSATSGSAIYYTTNGTTPNTSSRYTTPITVSTSETIKAFTGEGGYTSSPIVAAQYVITTSTPTPTISPAAGTYTTAQSITITDSASGASIYYTTDGSIPTTSSALYSGPITVASTETIQAVAIASGYALSTVATAAYTITAASAAAVPTFTPPPGFYMTPQSITITDATSGAAIYYTTDGSTPTTASTRYAGAISVSATETIKAIASANGFSSSPVGSATYTIATPTATPVISPASGSYTTAQTVIITDATSGAVIYYTTDGSVPTTTSTPYAGPISVASSETINAVAIASGYTLSPVASAIYTIAGTTATPIISPLSGVYFNAQNVIMTDATPGAIIYYTTNGTTPTTASTKYSVAFHVYTAATIQAIAVAPGYANSAVATTALTFTAASPTFSPPPGTYDTPQTVTITSATSGSAIYYTTNGTTPNTSSRYTAPITVSTSETIKAFTGEGGYTSSPIVAAQYVITSSSSLGPTKPHPPGPGSPLPTR